MKVKFCSAFFLRRVVLGRFCKYGDTTFSLLALVRCSGWGLGNTNIIKVVSVRVEMGLYSIFRFNI